jgi:hypothetical protein
MNSLIDENLDYKNENKKLHNKIQSILIKDDQVEELKSKMDVKFYESKIETMKLMLDE